MLAITTYEWYKAGHVLGAVGWAGGVMFVAVHSLVALRSPDVSYLFAFGARATKVGHWLVEPAAAIAIVFGIALVERANWGYDRFFVVYGLVGAALSLGRGVWLRITSGRFRAFVAGRALDDPELHRALTRRLWGAVVFDGALLLSIVFVMTTKPFL